MAEPGFDSRLSDCNIPVFHLYMRESSSFHNPTPLAPILQNVLQHLLLPRQILFAFSTAN